MPKGFIFGQVIAARLMTELRQVTRELPRAMEKADDAMAAEVAGKARQRARAGGGIRTRVASAVTHRGPTIVLDGSVHGAVVPAEFGRDRPGPFGPHRGPGLKGGYFMTPVLASDDAFERYIETIDEALD